MSHVLGPARPLLVQPRSLTAPETRAWVERHKLSLIRPLVAAHGAIQERDVLILRVTRSGIEAWSECSPIDGYSSVTVAEAETQIRSFAADWPDSSVEPSGAPEVRAAWADLMLDLDLLERNESLADRFGVQVGVVETAATFSALDQSVSNISTQVTAAIERGCSRVRVKVDAAAQPEALYAAGGAAASAGIPIVADANQSLVDGHPVLGHLVAAGFSAVEQPFGANDLEAHARLTADGELGVLLDESVTGSDALDRIVEARAATGVVIKPLRLGGLDAAYRMGQTARAAGMEVVVGGMWESSVGRTPLVALAAALATQPSEVGSPLHYLSTDLVAPMVAPPYRADVWSGPGCRPPVQRRYL